MVKNSWINPELKELSIENTLEMGDQWRCNKCGEVYTELFGVIWGKVCYNVIEKKDWFGGTYEGPCGSTSFTKVETSGGPS